MHLSPRQLTILNAVDASSHPRHVIAKRAGVADHSLRHWVGGHHEPSLPLFNAVMQAIHELRSIPANRRIDWDSRAGELRELRDQGMNHHQIARQLNASQSSVRRACIRWKI